MDRYNLLSFVRNICSLSISPSHSSAIYLHKSVRCFPLCLHYYGMWASYSLKLSFLIMCLITFNIFACQKFDKFCKTDQAGTCFLCRWGNNAIRHSTLASYNLVRPCWFRNSCKVFPHEWWTETWINARCPMRKAVSPYVADRFFVLSPVAEKE